MSSKLREALEELIKFTCGSCEQRFCEDDVEEEDGIRIPIPCSAIIKAREALAEPVRNCDVGTAREQAERFNDFCNSHYDLNNPEGVCLKCPLTRDGSTCEFEWTRMPYESEVK